MEQEESRLITKIEQQKRNSRRYNVYVEDEFSFSVHEDTMVKHRILKGKEIKTDWLKQIITEEENHKAYQYAVRILARRMLAVQELRMKLIQKEYTEEVINNIINKLQEQKYVDDAQFAKMWVEQRIYAQKKGVNWIRQELQQKGITSEIIENTLQQIHETAEWDNAYPIAVKKWQGLKEKKQGKTKLMAYLIRRGYDYDLVKKIIDRIENNES